MSNVAALGHNNPPSPFEESEKEITDLYDEAKQWLDGDPIKNEGMAEGVSKLLNLIRAAKKKADEARKEEKKPFDEGAKEVQGRYNPILKKADLAADTCKKALAPWLEQQEREKREAEEKARKEAEEKRKAAEDAIRASQVDDLEAREAAEAKLDEAKKAEAAASKASKDHAKSSGGVGRAVSLRTSWEPELVSGVEAARHYWQNNRAELEEWLLDMARKDIRAGVRSIPGFTITEIKKAV